MSHRHFIVKDRYSKRISLIILQGGFRSTASDIKRERRSTRSRGSSSLPRIGSLTQPHAWTSLIAPNKLTGTWKATLLNAR